MGEKGERSCLGLPLPVVIDAYVYSTTTVSLNFAMCCWACRVETLI